MQDDSGVITVGTRAKADGTLDTVRGHEGFWMGGAFRPVLSGGDGTDLETLRADLGRRADLSDEELADLETRLVAAAQAEAEGDADVEVLTELRDAVRDVRTDQTAREEAAQEHQRQVDELMADIEPQANAEGEGETPPGEGEEGAGDGSGEGEETPTPTPTEGETPAETPGETPAETPAETPNAEETPEAQAAAAATPPATRRTGSPRQMRRPSRAEPRTPSRTHSITAAAGIPGLRDGVEFDSLVAAAEAMIQRHQTFRGPARAEEYIPVVTLRREYPDDRRLVEGHDDQNAAIIASLTSPEAIIAAGGFCTPSSVEFDIPNISYAGTPVADSLPSVGAPRGGVRLPTAIPITELSGALTRWTEANDISARDDENVRKACLHVDCGDWTEYRLGADVVCVEFGNLAARANPERVADAMRSVLALQSRVSERRLLSRMSDLATANINTGQVLGAARDILTHLGRAVEAARQTHRTDPRLGLRIVLPSWVRQLIRNDLTRQMPGDDAISVADEEIEGYFRNLNVAPTWAIDGVTGGSYPQEFTTQGDGPLQGWPGGATHSVIGHLFHEGAFTRLDEGTLDLGLVRDSTLNSRNDYQMFSENFNELAYGGVFAWEIRFDVCDNGTASGLADIDPCTTGS